MKKILVLPDLQCPYHSAESIELIKRYAKNKYWDCLIILGDFLDYYCISKFNEGKPGMLEGKTIMAELQVGKRVLEQLVETVRTINPKCKIVYLEGNHEARAYQFAAMFPHLQGMIEPETVLQFSKLNIDYVKSWSESKVFSVGKAYFTHGRYTNLHHAKKMVEAYEENIFYGHTHDLNSYNKTSMGTGKTKVGQSMGCLCEYPKDVDYTKGAPKNWQQAFGVFFVNNDGSFNYYITRIFNHRFTSIDGEVFDIKDQNI